MYRTLCGRRRGSPSYLDTGRAVPTATAAAGSHVSVGAALVHDIEALFIISHSLSK
jgi:hypothetical protein